MLHRLEYAVYPRLRVCDLSDTRYRDSCQDQQVTGSIHLDFCEYIIEKKYN